MNLRYLLQPLVVRCRNVVRKHTRPKSIDEAEEIREMFAKLYALSTATLFVILLYNFATNSSGISRITCKPQENDRIIRIKNFVKVEDRIVTASDKESNYEY